MLPSELETITSEQIDKLDFLEQQKFVNTLPDILSNVQRLKDPKLSASKEKSIALLQQLVQRPVKTASLSKLLYSFFNEGTEKEQTSLSIVPMSNPKRR